MSEETTSERAPADVNDAESITTYREALRVFFSRPGPRLMAANAGLLWLARAALGPPGLADVAVCATVAAWWPLQEWLMHKHLLHLEPGRIDPLFARVHRYHHRHPREIDSTLLPLPVVVSAIPVASALFAVLLGPRRRTLSAMATYSSVALVYEWTHFLVHTGIAPKGEYYKKVRRNHRLHHFRNENYWLGFTAPVVDALLGTDPEPASVPHTKTAMDLHGIEAERQRSVTPGSPAQ